MDICSRNIVILVWTEHATGAGARCEERENRDPAADFLKWNRLHSPPDFFHQVPSQDGILVAETDTASIQQVHQIHRLRLSCRTPRRERKRGPDLGCIDADQGKEWRISLSIFRCLQDVHTFDTLHRSELSSSPKFRRKTTD